MAEKEVKAKDPVAEAWAKHLDAYKKKNPEKFAKKEKDGDFKEIPVSFKISLTQ